MSNKEEPSKEAELVYSLVKNKLTSNDPLHPGTVITATARLGGSFLFRTFGIQMDNATPGSMVLSDIANEKGPVLMQVLGNTLTSLGINPDPEKLNEAAPAESQLSYLQSQEILQEPVHAIMKENNLDNEQMAHACAIATAYLVRDFQDEIGCENGYYTAVYGFVEGCKTFPLSID